MQHQLPGRQLQAHHHYPPWAQSKSVGIRAAPRNDYFKALKQRGCSPKDSLSQHKALEMSMGVERGCLAPIVHHQEVGEVLPICPPSSRGKDQQQVSGPPAKVHLTLLQDQECKDSRYRTKHWREIWGDYSPETKLLFPKVRPLRAPSIHPSPLPQGNSKTYRKNQVPTMDPQGKDRVYV